MNKSAIHTFQLTGELSHKEFQKLKESFYDMHLKISRKKRTYEILNFANCGIRIFLINHKYYPYISFVVNPTEVLNNDSLTDLFHSGDDLTRVIETFNQQVSALNEEFSFERLSLNRVDMCCDLTLASSDEVTAYIALLRKSNCKKGYKIKGRKVKGYDQSIGFLCDNPSAGISVSVYNKAEQLKNIGRPMEAKKAEKRLRVEVQLKSKKAIYKYRQYGSNAEQLEFIIGTARERIRTILPDILIDADYYTLPEAIRIVAEYKSGKKRDRMIRLLELTSKKHSIRLGAEQLMLDYPDITPKCIKRLKENFHAINVNIVTLGRRSKVAFLESLIGRL